jgi:quercetin dioxygenase-like cupin family protein
MKRSRLPAVLLLTLLAYGSSAGQTQLPEADPGVQPTRLLDRAEVRVSRIELRAGATRRVHTHDDVEYHLWIPIEGSLALTIGKGPAIAAKPGEAHFMTRGTSHGFRNTGTTPAAVFEIFIKQSTRAGDDRADALAAHTATVAAARPIR